MSYTLHQPSSARRGGLLSIVIGLHVGVLLAVLAAKTIAPQMAETPLVVDLLPAPQVEDQPQARPLPVVQPQPVPRKPAPLPKAPAPVLETTNSAAPAELAPIAPPPEVEPSPPAPPVPPAVSQARFDTDYLRNPPPPYPPLARRMGEEGKVILRVSVTPQGTAEAVEIRTSSGSKRLDEAALKTVRNWKFIPAKRGDVAVQSWVLVPIIFKLEQ
ncbi:energy transducer TonB [Azonexus sp.]|uniref:energy transducer TonB n=1 Tax=Azonexus sp. TaxID=1872668 RepID=UPI0035AE94CD